MAAQFGFCANCGTPRASADQAFCPGCGSTFQPASPVAAAAVPPPPPPEAPGWAAVAAPIATPVPARRGMNPAILVGLVLLAAVIAGVVYFGFLQGGSASASLSPSSFSCSGPSVQVTMTVRLPGSLQGSDMVTSEVDGMKGDPERVDKGFKKDGSTWLSSDTVPSSTLCLLGTGKHTIRALDASGKVLVEGSWTANP